MGDGAIPGLTTSRCGGCHEHREGTYLPFLCVLRPEGTRFVIHPSFVHVTVAGGRRGWLT